MARYRIGDKFFSQEEYDEDMDFKWACGLFLIGSILTGFLVHNYLVSPSWHQAIRFIVTTVPAVTVGIAFVKLRHFISILLGLVVILGIASLVISMLLSII